MYNENIKNLGDYHMLKQTSHTHFSELTPAELQQISGGNWWTDWLNNFNMYNNSQKITDGIGYHKIG